MASVEQLTTSSENALRDINLLVHQLSAHAGDCPKELLEEIVADSNVELWVAREEDRIVGMGALVLVRIPEGIKGRVEDMIVDADHRGMGLGRSLMEKLVERARARDVFSLELSSRPSRDAANNLYIKSGFVPVETNVYRLKL